jgi:hypothetical protein
MIVNLFDLPRQLHDSQQLLTTTPNPMYSIILAPTWKYLANIHYAGNGLRLDEDCVFGSWRQLIEGAIFCWRSALRDGKTGSVRLSSVPLYKYALALRATFNETRDSNHYAGPSFA